MVLSVKRENELIPGYACLERIGAGGYGEVWSVEAPGGIPKAIKLVYGFVDEDRASRELKALNRIKEVRHPFLLALDRIEIVDNRLVIVTELADRSLFDRFSECRQEESSGIPRDELLHYIREAAEALDFMFDRFRLQHLDIKPENLLLLGDHIKVADFGLVKDQVDQTHSEVAGLTPIYAAPELFDGIASRQCDQYSLAIVYQQMLTGHLPFPGRTALQLASQHAKARPRVNWLSEADQAVVLKALSKQPEERFSSCRAFAEALANPPTSTVSATAAPPAASGDDIPEVDTSSTNTPSDANYDTSPVGAQKDRAAVMQTEAMGVESSAVVASPQPRVSIRVSSDVRSLAPLATDQASAGWRPTLFIGVGGTGSRILQAVRQELEQHCQLPAIDAVQFVYLDTDREDVQAVGSIEMREGGPRPAHLLVPLRRPQEYRSGSKELLAWMSRRWLYNIPPSLKTRGLRPLGRLAWIDNQQRTVQQLRKCLERLVAPEALEELAQISGEPCRDRVPRIYLVASAAGGTGGGMIFDVGAAVKGMLAELQVSDEGLLQLLVHSTNRRPKDCDLALANTYGTLSEYHHFSTRGAPPVVDAAPGDVQADESAAIATYFVHLGDHLNGEEYSTRLQRVATYLYCDLTTSVGSLLDHCRSSPQDEEEGDGEDVFLRSFQAESLTVMPPDLVSRSTEWVIGRVADEWSCEIVPRSAPTHTATAEDNTPPDTDSSDIPSAVAAPPLFSAALQQSVERAFAGHGHARFARALADRLEKDWSDKSDSSSQESQGRLRRLSECAGLAAEQFRALIQQVASARQSPDTSSAEKPAWADGPFTLALAEELDDRCAALSNDSLVEYLDQLLGSSELNSADGGETTLYVALETAVRVAVTAAIERLTEKFVASSGRQVIPGPVNPASALQSLGKTLDECGYATRDLLVVPSCATALIDSEGEGAKTISRVTANGQHSVPIAIREIERLSLVQLASALTRDRPDVIDAASRLHTRKDVSWAPLPEVE